LTFAFVSVLLLSLLGAMPAQAQADAEDGSSYELQVTRAPFSYQITASGREEALLAESRPDTARSALYFVTGEGTQYLTEPTRFNLSPASGLEATYRTTDGRKATVEILPAAKHDGWRVSVSFDDEAGIRRVGETLAARDGERFHGLTERVRGNNDNVPRGTDESIQLGRRGHRVKMDVNGSISLYAPFYLSSGASATDAQDGYGLYAETTWLGHFDMAKADPERVRFSFRGPSLTYHVFPGAPEAALEQYAQATAKPPLPPKWGLGVWRWRNDHYNRDTLSGGQPYRGPINSMAYEDVMMAEKLGVPQDVYWVDRPWAKGPYGYSDFQWDPERFPSAEGMVEWLGEEHDQRFVVWLAPWVMGEMATEALSKGYFLPTKGMVELGITQAGSDKVNDLEFLRSIKPQLIRLIEGVSGRWASVAARAHLSEQQRRQLAEDPQDMDYNQILTRHVRQADTVEELRPLLSVDDHSYVMVDFTNPAAKAWWQEYVGGLLEQGVDAFKLDRSEEFVPDARDAYAHNGWSMARLQNEYPVLYAEAVYEVAKEHRPDGDFAVMPRAGWTGSQQYAVFWSGDAEASWRGLRNTLIGGQRAALMGFPFWTSDTGGFITRTNEALFSRWLGMSAFSPIMEVGPVELGGKYDNSPWSIPEADGTSEDGSGGDRYNAKTAAAWRTYAKLHKHLQDYIYDYAREARRTGHPIMRPLFYEHPGDERAWEAWDQYYFGEDYLVAPVIEEGKREREVYLPAGRWRDYWNPEGGEVLEGPTTVTVEAPLYKTPIFLRAGSQEEILDLEALYRESLQIARERPELDDGSEISVK